MSAIAPKNSSPAIVVEKKDVVQSKTKQLYSNATMGMENSTKDVVLEIIVLAGAAVAVVMVTYLLFKPLFSGLFGSITDTITSITDVTAEALGTVTEVLGGVIEDASAAVGTVVGAINTTIGTLGTSITGTLTSVTGSVSTVSGAVNSTISTATTAVNTAIGGVVTTFNTLVDNQNLIITAVISSLDTYIPAIQAVMTTASNEFQALIASLREGADTVVQGVQDGIRYLVDPFVNETYGIPAIGNQMLSTITTLTTSIDSTGTNIKDALDSISAAISGL